MATEKVDGPFGPEETHESYATIRLTRRTSGGAGQVLFGSSIRHNTVIGVSIVPARVCRHLNHDSYFADGHPLISFEMSFSQFSELLTSMGQADGVPCTVTSLVGKPVDRPPFRSKRQQFHDEFQAKCRSLGEQMAEAQTYAASLVDKPSVTKADRVTLLGKIRDLRNAICSGLPFVSSQFQEQMEKSVQEARGEVEAFYQSRVVMAGMGSVPQEAPLVALEAPVPTNGESPDGR